MLIVPLFLEPGALSVTFLGLYPGSLDYTVTLTGGPYRD